MAIDDSLFDDALFSDDPEAGRRLEALRAAQPEAARLFEQWSAVRSAVREDLAQALPDRALLVLHALDASGRAAALTPSEAARLEADRPLLEAALEARPYLKDAAADIARQADAFEAVWEERLGLAPESPAAAGRAPLRLAVGRTLWKAAALAAVVVFAALVFTLLRRDAGLTTVTAEAGAPRVVALEDGSEARLAEGARLTYDARQGRFNRRVRLEGRAYFDVAKQAQPFVVETESAATTVLGTTFSVSAADGLTEVVLVTGKVALAPKSAPAQMVVLRPGEMSRVQQGALPSTPAPVDVAEALAWTGSFFFEAAPLGRIAGQLEKAYGITVDVAPALAGEAVYGEFSRRQPPREVLGAIAATLGAKLTVRSDTSFALGEAIRPPGR